MSIFGQRFGEHLTNYEGQTPQDTRIRQDALPKPRFNLSAFNHYRTGLMCGDTEFLPSPFVLVAGRTSTLPWLRALRGRCPTCLRLAHTDLCLAGFQISERGAQVRLREERDAECRRLWRTSRLSNINARRIASPSHPLHQAPLLGVFGMAARAS